MPLTQNCDIFAAFHETGFNRIVEHVRLQRPSLFNYATPDVIASPEMLCKKIETHPIVARRNNPLITKVDLLPVPGTNYGVNFSAQLTKLAVDFNPSNVISLPPELSPLASQQFALQISFCSGFGCPPKEILDRYIPPPEEPRKDKERPEKEKPPVKGLIPLPNRGLICFCLDAFATGGFRQKTYNGKIYIEPFLTGFEIVDIKPEGLENSMECYISLILRLAILPKLRIQLETFTMELMKDVLNVHVSLTPAGGNVPNNPSIANDQLSAFIKVEVN
jgi:hypothetical protein